MRQRSFLGKCVIAICLMQSISVQSMVKTPNGIKVDINLLKKIEYALRCYFINKHSSDTTIGQAMYAGQSVREMMVRVVKRENLFDIADYAEHHADLLRLCYFYGYDEHLDMYIKWLDHLVKSLDQSKDYGVQK